MWLPLSTLTQTLQVVLGPNVDVEKKVTVRVCIDDVLLFPRVTQAVAQLQVALTWKWNRMVWERASRCCQKLKQS